MKCCGIFGPNDWNGTDLPRSCCPNQRDIADGLGVNCTEANATKLGCKSILLKYFEHMTTLLAGVGVGIGWIQV